MFLNSALTSKAHLIRLLFGRYEHKVICFWDFLTFSQKIYSCVWFAHASMKKKSSKVWYSFKIPEIFSTKGQQISKADYGKVHSPKKWSFFGRIYDTLICFRDLVTFTMTTQSAQQQQKCKIHLSFYSTWEL